MKSVDPGILPQSVCFSFTPSELAQRFYYYPTWCGHYYCNSNYFMKRESYPPLLLAFIRQGVFHIEYDGEVFDAKKGDVVFLDCQKPHYYHAEDGLEFLYIHIDGTNSHELCQYILSQSGALIKQESNSLIEEELLKMIEFYTHDGIETMFQSAMRIQRLFEYLLTPDGLKKDKDNPLDKTIHYIRDNVGKDISLDTLAKIAHLSPYYYSHCFKKYTGFSPIDFVINTRIEKAKILLARTTYSIEEIAYQLGYASSNSLVNVFVKRVGMSPRQYRRSNQSPR